jgi:hypothetical protein
LIASEQWAAKNANAVTFSCLLRSPQQRRPAATDRR